MEYSWLAKLRADLFTKLGTYSDVKTKHANDKAVIFTNDPDIWKMDQVGLIMKRQPLPPIPPAYNRYSMDITEEAINFYKCVIQKRIYTPILVILFEFEVHGRSEIHVIFAADKTLQKNPIKAYLKESRTIVRIRQYSNYLDEDCLSYTGSKLSPEMKSNLDSKLKIFFEITARDSVITSVVTFQDEPGFWPIDLKFQEYEEVTHQCVWVGSPTKQREIKRPVRYPHEPIRLPRDSQSRIADVARSVLDYVKEQASKMQPFMPFYACCSEVGMKTYLEIHELFTRDEATVASMRALGGYLTTEDPPATSTIAGPSKSVTKSLEIHQYVENRLSDELKKDLDRRMILFMCMYKPFEKQPGFRAVIFNDERHFWPRFIKIVSLRMPLPPLPSKDDYDYEEYDIERDVLDYVKMMAVRKVFGPFFAASFRYEDDLHLLFTKDEKLISELASVDYPTTEDPLTDSRVIHAPAEYRFYTSETTDFITVESTIKRFSRRANFGTKPTRYGLTSGTLNLTEDNDENKEFREVSMRLGLRLREYLFVYVHEFNERPQEHRHSAVIFTDDERCWKWFRDPIFVTGGLPPIPPYYEHEKYDIVKDMVAFLRTAAKEVIGEPIYVIAVKTGTGDQAEVHFLLSRYKEMSKQFEFKTGADPYPSPPPPSESGSDSTSKDARPSAELTTSAPGSNRILFPPHSNRSAPAIMGEHANAGSSTVQHGKLEMTSSASAELLSDDIIDNRTAFESLRLDSNEDEENENIEDEG